ncbi:MAG: hypothetical protein H6508_02120 [Calditrichaeota bacterium]|nr:hypothetical protein [Calditrichota bacterium]
MKKLLPTIGLYVGTFIVLNVAMYFILRFTQPQPSPSEVAAHEASADSAGVHADSTHAIEHHSDSTHAEFDPEFTDDHQTEQQADHAGSEDGVPETAHAAAETHSQESNAQKPDSEAHATPKPETSEETAALEEQDSPDSPRSEAEIAKLAKMLEGMKPTEAATIAERLPAETIVQLVMRMKARNGAKMMASLPVPLAASVAERMAELSGAKKSS